LDDRIIVVSHYNVSTQPADATAKSEDPNIERSDYLEGTISGSYLFPDCLILTTGIGILRFKIYEKTFEFNYKGQF
jgi:hypothetical protein